VQELPLLQQSGLPQINWVVYEVPQGDEGEVIV
jgi:hypothetical protein